MKASVIRTGLIRALDHYDREDGVDLRDILATVRMKLQEINPDFNILLDYRDGVDPADQEIAVGIDLADAEPPPSAFATAIAMGLNQAPWIGLLLSRDADVLAIPVHHTARTVTFEKTDRTPTFPILWEAKGAQARTIDYLVDVVPDYFGGPA